MSHLKHHETSLIVLLQIVVQGVPFAYAWQELKDLFKPLGAVKADIVMGSDRRSKGWGTVLFDSESDAENAIKVMQLSTHVAQRCVCRHAFKMQHVAITQQQFYAWLKQNKICTSTQSCYKHGNS